MSYRKFKQTDFNKKIFIVDIMSFLTQNFNPINLDRKLDQEKEGDMIKFLWDECIPHDFVRYMYLPKYYDVLSSLHLTYQKANEMVSSYFLEDLNRINIAKFKIKEKFQLIHYVYSLLFSKIYSRTNNFGIQKKNTFDFHVQTWKNRKTAGAVGSKILKQLPQSIANQVTCDVLQTAKDPSNYQERTVHKNEQKPTDFKMVDDERLTMVKPNETVKKRAEKRKLLEKQLSENTIKMKKIKSNKL